MSPREHDYNELRWRIENIVEARVSIEGQSFPRRFDARLSHPNWPLTAVVTVGMDAERGPVLTGVRALVNPDTSKPIHTVREATRLISDTIDEALLLRELASDAVGEVVKWALYNDGPAAIQMSEEEMQERITEMNSAAELARRDAYPVSQPRRRRLITTAYLQEVARVYRDAMSEGLAPTKAVEKHFQTSYSNAAKYVARARQAGQLGEAKGTQPGEQS
ncbi:hypothetical protein [Aeromicrobium sp.]|uniref:hypothetical protein n=1 Tax=Aeromicrobium sp. TaxID=1871063 RepID=UPI0030C0C98E